MRDFFRNSIFPRVPHLAWLILVPWLLAVAFVRSVRRFPRGRGENSGYSIVIEAGTRGWESIEFNELYRSAKEYFGCERVVRLVVRQEVDYVGQVKGILDANPVSHYVYDPRTGSQEWVKALWQSMQVATYLSYRNIVPIVLLTDFSLRRWRVQSAIVSAIKGVVVIFMAARIVSPIFPHRRLIGPCLMPLSVQMLEDLAQSLKKRPENSVPRAVFVGSLYEPRASTLAAIEAGVRAGGGIFECIGRQIGTARKPDREYWTRLIEADIVFTTASQMQQRGTDWSFIPHLVYRYLEVLVSGSLLIAEDVPSVRRFFTPGIHFISFESIDDGVDKILFYLKNHELRKRIANNGKCQAVALVRSRTFWLMIDSFLGKDSLH